MTVGATKSTLGVKVRDFWAGLKVEKGHKPEWGLEWQKDF